MSIKLYKLKMHQNFIRNGSRVRHYSYYTTSIMMTEPADYEKIPFHADLEDDRWIRVASISPVKGMMPNAEEVLEILSFLGFDMARRISQEASPYTPYPGCEITQFYRQPIIPRNINDADINEKALAIAGIQAAEKADILIELDPDKIRTLAQSAGISMPSDEIAFWAVVHLARMLTHGMPRREYEQSSLWLQFQGLLTEENVMQNKKVPDKANKWAFQ